MNPEIVSFQYATGLSLLLEIVGGCVHAGRPEVVTLKICNWPVLFRATHILQEKTHAFGVLKRQYFRVHVSLGSAETLVRRGGIINHHSIAYSLSNISVKNYRNWLMWVESIVCNISVVFLRHSVYIEKVYYPGMASWQCFNRSRVSNTSRGQ